MRPKVEFENYAKNTRTSNFINMLKWCKDQKIMDFLIKDLTKIKKIGKWTTEMHLIFSYGRENVKSKTDGTIKRTVKWLYNINEIPDVKLIQKIFEK